MIKGHAAFDATANPEGSWTLLLNGQRFQYLTMRKFAVWLKLRVLFCVHARPIIDAMTTWYYCSCHCEPQSLAGPTATRGVVDRQLSEDNTRTQLFVATLRCKHCVSDYG